MILYLFIVLAIVIYVYLIYPVVLWCISHHKRIRVDRFQYHELPYISVVVVVRNAANYIEEKIRNTLQCIYPSDNIEYLFVSDGSEDDTVSIINRYSQIKLIEFQGHVGKETALCSAIAKAKGEVLCFTDGTVYLESDSLVKLIEPFKTTCVGGVSSRDKIKRSLVSLEWFHVSHEIFLRSIESLSLGLVGMSGSLFAVRRHIANQLTPHTCSDFSLAIISRILGYRTIQESDALASYSLLESNRLEYVRKARTITHGINTTVKWLPSLLRERQYAYFWQLFSHKFLRWFCPLLATICIPCFLLHLNDFHNTLLQSISENISIISVFALFSVCLIWKTRRVVVQLVYFAFAVLVAVFNVILNKVENRWEPTKRY